MRAWEDVLEARQWMLGMFIGVIASCCKGISELLCRRRLLGRGEAASVIFGAQPCADTLCCSDDGPANGTTNQCHDAPPMITRGSSSVASYQYLSPTYIPLFHSALVGSHISIRSLSWKTGTPRNRVAQVHARNFSQHIKGSTQIAEIGASLL